MERLLNEFIEHEKRKKFASSTVNDHERTLLVFLNFIKTDYPDVKELTDITKDIVRAYEIYLAAKKDCRKKTMSRDRRRRHLSDLKAFFLYLQKSEKIYRDPSSGVALPKLRESIVKDVLTIDEMDKLLLNCTGHSMQSLRDRAILELLYSTGIRAMELCSLETEDVDLNEKVLFIRKGKGSRERYTPFGESARYWLQRYIEKVRPLLECEKGSLLFCTLRGTPLTPDSLLSMVKKRAKSSGIEKNITTHTFRHSCATHMLKGRADIRYVQQQLGHRSIGTTERYLKIEISDLKEVHSRCHPRERDE
jgi:integrase/recombinase XerD